MRYEQDQIDNNFITLIQITVPGIAELLATEYVSHAFRKHPFYKKEMMIKAFFKQFQSIFWKCYSDKMMLMRGCSDWPLERFGDQTMVIIIKGDQKWA